MLTRNRGIVGLYAMGAAVAAVIFAPLLTLSYLATAEGAEGLEMPTVAAWAEPARDIAGGLLTFASVDRVYSTYTQIFAFLAPAILLCALVVRSSRRDADQRGSERWGWRIALPGYGLAVVGLISVAVLLIGMQPSAGIVNTMFVATMFPGMLLGLIGFTVLGIGLVRSGYRPRATAWLLALAFPLGIVGSVLLGHNSLGMLPIFIAWGLTGRRLWREEAAESAPERSVRAAA